MKKFEFSMQKILDYKSNLKDREKNILHQMNIQCQKLDQEIEEMKYEYEELKQKYMQMCEMGIRISEMSISKHHMDETRQKIKELLTNLQTAEQELEEQRNVVIEVSKDKSVMSKLKDQQYEGYKQKQRNSLELFVDDFVANTNHYANKV